MIAILHYAWLKGTRDKSLLAFAFVPAAQVAAMLIGRAIYMRHVDFPLLAPGLDRADIRTISILIPWFIAVLCSFWIFRVELATNVITSFVVASRPLLVVLALVLLGTLIAVLGLFGGLAMIALLTGDFPQQLASHWWLSALAALAGAALGTLYVMISPQPAMLGWAFLAAAPAGPLLFVPKHWDRLPPVSLLVTLICVAASTLLLRRRCAT